MDIVEFLKARLDEDEAAAEEAVAIRDVEAKRAIIEFHDKWPVLVARPMTIEQVPSAGVNDLAFRASQQIAWLTTRGYVRQFGGEPPAAPMLAALASAYADHEDFQSEWSDS